MKKLNTYEEKNIDEMMKIWSCLKIMITYNYYNYIKSIWKKWLPF